MMQMSAAGGLLAQLYDDSECLGDAVATASGIQIDRARAAAIGAMGLTLSEQLRLSEAAMLHAPRYRQQALRLRGQVLDARSSEDGAVLLHPQLAAHRPQRSISSGW
jgi:hypothetical protein